MTTTKPNYGKYVLWFLIPFLCVLVPLYIKESREAVHYRQIMRNIAKEHIQITKYMKQYDYPYSHNPYRSNPLFPEY